MALDNSFYLSFSFPFGKTGWGWGQREDAGFDGQTTKTPVLSKKYIRMLPQTTDHPSF